MAHHPDKRVGTPCPALHFYRTNRGLSQEALARKAGLSASVVLRLEHGGRARLATITALAYALRVERAALTLPAPDAHRARVNLPPAMPLITRPPSLDLAAVDPVAWLRPALPANVISFAERAPAARARRQLRQDARLHRSREPWA